MKVNKERYKIMEYIPLETDYSFYDQKDCEVKIVRKIYRHENICDTVKMFNIMKKSLWTGFRKNNRAHILIAKAYELKNSEQFKKAKELCTLALHIAPRDSVSHYEALYTRSQCFLSLEQYKDAIKDVEQIKKLNIEPYFILDALLVSIICNLVLGDKNGAFKEIELVKDLNRTVVSAKIKTCQNNMKTTKKKKRDNNTIEPYVTEAKLATMEKAASKIIRTKLCPEFVEVTNAKPFMGYSSNPKLMRASVACTLISSTNNPDNGKVLANRPIPRSEIVLVDKPLISAVEGANLQCDFCSINGVNLYPCSDCHFFYYCSIECKDKDHNFHKYECKGFQMYVIQSLNAKVLLRLLIRGLIFMKKEVFTDVKIRAHQTAEELLKFIIEKSKAKPNYEYCNVLNWPTKLNELTEEHFRQCVSTSLRLTIYIKEHTTIFQDFCHGFQYIKKIELEILLASLILRHASQIKSKQWVLEIVMNVEPQSFVKIASNDGSFNLNLVENSIYPIDYIRNILKENMESIQFKDKSNGRKKSGKTKISIIDEYTVPLKNCVQKFEDEFPIIYSSHNKPFDQRIKNIYPTVTTFRHSCNPNLLFVPLSQGVLIARAIRDIQPGEELTISYGPHYKSAPTLIRQQNLKEIYNECSCECCLSDIEYCLTDRECSSCKEKMMKMGQCFYCDFEIFNMNDIESYLLQIEHSVSYCETYLDVYNKSKLIFQMIIDKIPENTFPNYIFKLYFAKILIKEYFLDAAVKILSNIKNFPNDMWPEMSLNLIFHKVEILKPLVNILTVYFTTSEPQFSRKDFQLFTKVYKLAQNIINDAIELAKWHFYDGHCLHEIQFHKLFLHKNRFKIFVDDDE